MSLPTIGALPLCSAAGQGVACTNITADGVMWQTIIHMAFIVSAIGITWTDRLILGSAAVKTANSH